MRRWPVIVVAASCRPVDSSALLAHHCSAAFDTGKTVVLKGNVRRGCIPIPLPSEARGGGCKRQRQGVDCRGPGAERHLPGLSPGLFQAGVQLTVTVEPVKEISQWGASSSPSRERQTLGRASAASPYRSPYGYLSGSDMLPRGLAPACYSPSLTAQHSISRISNVGDCTSETSGAPSRFGVHSGRR